MMTDRKSMTTTVPALTHSLTGTCSETSTSPLLPVTLLSGFLGAGKTTLLLDILRNKQGLRCAVIVNDMAALNIDAAIVAKSEILHREEELIKLQNGCICCTLRGDLLREINRIASTKQYDYLIIESTGVSEPMQVAETFAAPPEMLVPPPTETDNDDDEEEEDDDDDEAAGIDITHDKPPLSTLSSLLNVARLDTCVTVVDSSTFFDYVESIKFLKDEFLEAERDDTERTVANLLIEQIEFANVVVLNKTSLVNVEVLEKLKGFIATLNPSAMIIETNFSKVPLENVLNTGLFDLNAAQRAPGWLQSLTIGHTPETEEYGIGSFVYHSNRPFHAQRLFDLLTEYFFLLESSYAVEPEAVLDESEKRIADNDSVDICSSLLVKYDTSDYISTTTVEPDSSAAKPSAVDEAERKKRLAARLASPFRGLLRSKGYFWLATRPHSIGEWGHAGAILRIDCAGLWDDEAEEEEEKEYSDEDEYHAAAPSTAAPRQEIVFIGCFQGNERALLIQRLDSCLLTDREMEQFDSGRLDGFEDPWEEWPPVEEEDEDEEEEDEEEKEEQVAVPECENHTKADDHHDSCHNRRRGLKENEDQCSLIPPFSLSTTNYSSIPHATKRLRSNTTFDADLMHTMAVSGRDMSRK